MSITVSDKKLPLEIARKYEKLAPGHILAARVKRKHALAIAFVDSEEILGFIEAVDDLMASIDLKFEMGDVIHTPELMELYCALGVLSERRSFYIKQRSAAIKTFCEMPQEALLSFMECYYEGLAVIVGPSNPTTLPALIIEWLNVRNHDRKIIDVLQGVNNRKLIVVPLHNQTS